MTTENEIADCLNKIMKEKGITAYFLIEKKGVAKKKAYSVLQKGKAQNLNYTIKTFLEVINAVGVELKFHELTRK